MDMRKAINGVPATSEASRRRVGQGWKSAAAGVALSALGLMGTDLATRAAPADTPGNASATARPDVPEARRAALDPIQVIASQIRLEKGGDMQGLLSGSFRAAYQAAPKDDDELGATIFGVGYDVPDKVVKVSDLKYDDPANPGRASAKATLHFNNPDAPVASFNRDVVVAFVKEDGEWRIDDVRLFGNEAARGRRSTREAWLKRGYEALAKAPKNLPTASADPVCAPPVSSRTSPESPAGFSPLTQIASHDGDPGRQTIAEKFVKAIGSPCPFGYQLVDVNGDGLIDLVLQLSDRKLGATDAGLRRTVVYALDRQGKWQPVIDGLARYVSMRTDRSGDPEVALSGNAGAAYQSWRWTGASFIPSKP